MKDRNHFYESLIKYIEKNIKGEIEKGSVLDMFVNGCADANYEAYKEALENVDPHIYTNLKGDRIDNLASLFHDLYRYDAEPDHSFLKRVLDWTYTMESSNLTAIENSITNLRYSSNAFYLPKSHGCGTGTIYIIPISYDEDIKKMAIEEINERIKNVISPGSYTEVLITVPKKVDLFININCGDFEIAQIKDIMYNNIKYYINSIAPGDCLKVGMINKIGINQENVSFFAVTQLNIEDEQINATEVKQNTDTKFILNTINWIEVK